MRFHAVADNQHMNRFDDAQTAAMLAELGQGGGTEGEG